ncbi:hypothetical protein JXQ70_19185 [bacterium]|nr:hypothetical protein [bacterium]
MDMLTLITVTDSLELGQQLKGLLVESQTDQVHILSLCSFEELLARIRTMAPEEIAQIALLIFSYTANENVATMIEQVNKIVPECQLMAIFDATEATQILELFMQVPLDRLAIKPLDPHTFHQNVASLIELFLEHKILRRSVTDIRQTYETMKDQYQIIKEANLRLDRKILELVTLSEIGRELMAFYNQNDIYTGTVLTLIGQKGAAWIIIFFVNEQNHCLEVKAHRGIQAGHNALNMTIPLESPLLDDLFRPCRPRFVEGMHFSTDNQPDFSPLDDLAGQILIPLINKGVRKGFILLGPKINQSNYSKEDFDFFSILANQMVFALDNAHLYTKLETKIAELERANKELRQLDRMKSEFITIASHELRTPLTSIRGYTDLLMVGKFGQLTSTQYQAIEIVTKNVERLIRISHDVVQLSKIDANRLTLNMATHHFDTIVHDVVEEMRPIAQARNLSLSMTSQDVCPLVHVDSVLMNQVISELLQNAIRFTPDGGRINITIDTVSPDEIPVHYVPSSNQDLFMRVRIRDNGIGIPAEEYERIFERFYEVQRSDFHHSGQYEFKSGGTGLGLAVTKGIIQKHGGHIWVTSTMESEPDASGSEFVFVLPLASQSENHSR